jgi:hypothetical protein
MCNCCGKAASMSAVAGRLVYTIVFFIFSFIAWIFRSWAQKILKWVPVLSHACDKEDVCYGTLAVYRISFCLALFHVFLALITIGTSRKGDCRVQLQDGFWGVKVIILAGMCVGAFFIPNAFFEYYGWFALVASGVFILVQLVLLVDFAHSWAENWIGKHEEAEDGDKKWWWFMLGATGVLFFAALGLTITMYAVFNSCGKNVAFVTINLLLCVVMSAMSIHPKVQETSPASGILQPALISCYCTYLIFSSIQSEDDGCNPWRATTSASNTSLLIGAIFTICAVCYGTFRASSTIGAVEPEKETLIQDTESTGEGAAEVKEHSDPDEPLTYSFTRFHIVFALGAMYIAMLMTDWQTVYNPGKGANSPPNVDSGLAAVWVKVVSSWICVGIYLWTLSGPILFPDRDWSH